MYVEVNLQNLKLHIINSIYVITRCVCVYVRTSVAGCPEARRGVPVDLTRHKERAHCRRAVISQGRQQLQGHDRLNSRVQVRMARQRRSQLSDYRTPLE